MATPSYVTAGAGAAVATTGTLNVAYPAVTSGDLLLLQATVRNATTTITTPSGWTPLYGPDNGGATVTVRQYVFGRVSDGTESGNVGLTYGSDAAVLKLGRIYRFTGNLTSGYIDTGATATTVGTSASISMPSSATGGPNRLSLALVFVSDDNAVADATGETGGDWIEAVAEYTSTAGLDGCIQLQNADMTGGGTISGGATSMAASDPWGCRTLAIIGSAAVSLAPLLPLMGVQ